MHGHEAPFPGGRGGQVAVALLEPSLLLGTLLYLCLPPLNC